jgi:hypothetical protein
MKIPNSTKLRRQVELTDPVEQLNCAADRDATHPRRSNDGFSETTRVATATNCLAW